MPFSINKYIGHKGERFALLFHPDQPAFPMFYPAAYIARNYRTYPFNTQLSVLQGIRRVAEWERDNKVNLEVMFSQGITLTASQVDNLAHHMRSGRHHPQDSVISRKKFNILWAFGARYINWLATELFPDANTKKNRDALDKQAEGLSEKRIRKQGSEARAQQKILNTKLTNEARTKLIELFQNPLKDLSLASAYPSRFRTVVILRILYESGIRRGEALSLKLRNVVEASGGESAFLLIERNHHDIVDTRLNQPVAKTLGRKLPISEALERQILEYLSAYRAEVPGVGFSPEDYVFVVHLSGQSQGRALSINALDSSITKLKRSYPKLLSALHPHLLRHDFNYRLSQKCDDDSISEQEERENREYLNGWVQGSKMAKTYNQRHIIEKAIALGRKIAKDTERPKQ